MLKNSASFVLSRSSPCNVPQGYASVADLPAALLDELFEHPARCSPLALDVRIIKSQDLADLRHHHIPALLHLRRAFI